jgi:hypothetical protein
MSVCFQQKRIGMAEAKPRPQVFEKSGFACFSKTLAPRIQTSVNATWCEISA